MRRFAFLSDNIGYMRRIVCKKGGGFLYLHEQSIMSIVGARPAARAVLRGDEKHPGLRGYADFFPYRCGTVVIAELWGLPQDPGPCASNIFAMHIHATGDCTGDMDMSFSSAGGHYNPKNCPHPAHAGDMPPLFSNRGYAWQGFYTDRFAPSEIMGRSVIIHAKRDDFTTQPSGDAGDRIGCGVILGLR